MTADLTPEPPDYEPALDDPRGHPFEDGGDGECLTCGRACDPYGMKTPPAFADVPQEIPVCSFCRHYRHREACDAVVSGWSQRACGCRAVAA